MSTLRRLCALATLTSLTACTYGPAEDSARAVQIVPLHDSFAAIVVVRYDRYRRPTGLNTFPDGGKWRYESRSAYEYLIDADARTVEPLGSQGARDDVWESFDAHVRGLEGDSVAFLALTGCPRGGECHPGLDETELLRVSLDGTSTPVSEVPPSVALPGTMARRDALRALQPGG